MRFKIKGNARSGDSRFVADPKSMTAYAVGDKQFPVEVVEVDGRTFRFGGLTKVAVYSDSQDVDGFTVKLVVEKISRKAESAAPSEASSGSLSPEFVELVAGMICREAGRRKVTVADRDAALKRILES